MLLSTVVLSIYIHTCIHTYKQTNIHTYMHAYIYIYMYIPSTHLQLCSFAIVLICNWPAHSTAHSPCALSFTAPHSPKRCDSGETANY